MFIFLAGVKNKSVSNTLKIQPLKSESLIVHLTAILEELGKSNEANNGLIQDLIDSARQTTSPELATLFEQEPCLSIINYLQGASLLFALLYLLKNHQSRKSRV